MCFRWTQPAAQDLTQICDYIEKHGSSATACRVALSIHERISTLAEFPERDLLGRLRGTREVVLTGLPYLAIYRLKEDDVEILRILHGAQVWPK